MASYLTMLDHLNTSLLTQYALIKSHPLFFGKMGDIHRNIFPEQSVHFLQGQPFRLGEVNPNDNDRNRRQDRKDDVVLPPNGSEGSRRRTGEDDSREEQAADADGGASSAEMTREDLGAEDVRRGVDADAEESDVDEEERDGCRLAGFVGRVLIDGEEPHFHDEGYEATSEADD